MYNAIYLVDDFEMVNLLHRMLFRKLGMEEIVKEFTNPAEALEDLRYVLWKKKRILIILDINMPEMSGSEFLKLMVQEGFPPTIDVIVVTSTIENSEMDLAKNYPQFIENYVLKPLSLSQVEEIVNKTSNSKKSVLANAERHSQPIYPALN